MWNANTYATSLMPQTIAGLMSLQREMMSRWQDAMIASMDMSLSMMKSMDSLMRQAMPSLETSVETLADKSGDLVAQGARATERMAESMGDAVKKSGEIGKASIPLPR